MDELVSVLIWLLRVFQTQWTDGIEVWRLASLA